MRTLLNFFIKYHALFLFLLLEIVCVTFIVKYNNFQRVKVFNSSNYISGEIYESFHGIKDYLSLRKVNEELADENLKLRNELYILSHAKRHNSDSLVINNQAIKSISAKVVNNTVNKRYNYITINKGRKDGVKPDMGIIGPDGVIGMIINVSEHYAMALSVLNGRWKLSAKLAESNYSGSLSWDGQNPYVVLLEEIPFHVPITVDEEVYTSGFSSVFPEGILIGRVISAEHSRGANFQKIRVQLSSDFHKLYYVDVIEEKDKSEKLKLENSYTDE